MQFRIHKNVRVPFHLPLHEQFLWAMRGDSQGVVAVLSQEDLKSESGLAAFIRATTSWTNLRDSQFSVLRVSHKKPIQTAKVPGDAGRFWENWRTYGRCEFGARSGRQQAAT